MFLPRLIVRSVCAGFVALACSFVFSGCADKEDYLKRGDEQASKGNYREAVIHYRNAVRRDEKFGEARLKLADAYAQTGDVQRAAGEYIRAADLLENDATAQVKAGKVLLAFGRVDDAKARAERALKVDAKSVEGLVLLGAALAQLKDVDAAIAQVEEAARLAPARGDTFVSLGALQISKGNREQGEAAFRQALAVNPNSMIAHLALANFYASTDRVPAAEQLLKKALTLEGSRLDARRFLAALYSATARPQEAERELQLIADEAPDPRYRLLLVDQYITLKRFDEARAQLEKVRESSPASEMTVQLNYAQIANAEGRRAEAYKQIDDVLAKSKNNAAAHSLKAELLLGDRKLDEALSEAQLAVAADSKFAPGHHVLGRVYAARGDLPEATTAFTEVLKLNPRAVSAQLQLADLEIKSGRPEQALKFANESVGLAPRSADARLTVVRALIAQGKGREAAADLKPIVQALPQLAVVHTLQGAVDMLNGQLAAAEASYSRALALDPTSTSALNGLVIVYVAKGDMKLAVSRAEAEVGRRPENADVLQIAAWVHQRAGNVAAAEKHLIRCIEVAPDRLKAYEALGTLYAQQNRLPDAVAKFEEVSRRRPRSVAPHTMVAMLLEAQNRIDEAQRRYELIMALDQNATVAANNLAYLYIERGQKLDQALQLAQAAKAGRPDDPDINDTLGWVYYKRGLPQLARDPLEQSVKTDPKNPTYQYHLGLTLLKLGEQTRARAALEAALKLQPDGALAGEAKQALTTM